MAVLTRRQRGMTLVELLVAMAILGVVILSVIGLFTQSISLNSSGMDYTRVNDLARSRVEELVSLPFDHPTIAVPQGQDALVIPNDVDPTNANRLFDRVAEVRDVHLQKQGNVNEELQTPVAAGEANAKLITVTVSSRRSFLSGRREMRLSVIRADGLRY